MSNVQNAAGIIAQALAQLGMQVPEPMPDTVSVTLKTGTVLWLEALDGGKRVCIWNELLQWPAPEDEPALFETLLRLHAFGTATQGATFAANREAGTVIVFKSFPTAHLDAGWLAEELESLVVLVAQVQDMGRAGQLTGNASAAAAIPGGMPTFA